MVVDLDCFSVSLLFSLGSFKTSCLVLVLDSVMVTVLTPAYKGFPHNLDKSVLYKRNSVQTHAI